MTAKLRFISAPTADTPGTLLALNFDDKRYLFGQAGEGSQRVCLQRGVNMIKTKALFLSGKVGWQNTGGMTGLALTLADTLKSHVKALEESGVKRVPDAELGMTVYGGNGLLHSVASGRKYIFRNGGYVRFRELQRVQQEGPDFEDGNIKVWAMRIKSDQSAEVDCVEEPDEEQMNAQETIRQVVSNMWESAWRIDSLDRVELQNVRLPVTALWERDPITQDLIPFTGPLPDGETPLADPHKIVFVRKPWPNASVTDIPQFKSDGAAISYLIKTYAKRGKFNRKAAEDLDVEPGPDYAALARGETVVNSKGETITPDMVLGPGKPGVGILVLDIPDSSYLDDLLLRLDKLSDEIDQVVVAAWILPPQLANHASIRSFMERTKHIEHIIAAEDICANSITLQTTDRLTSTLRSVLPDFIARQICDDRASSQLDAALEPESLHVNPATINRQMAISPSFKEEDVPPVAEEDQAPSAELPGLITQAQDWNHEHAGVFEKWRSTLTMPDPEILFLGTGSAIPALTRNVTGILLRIPNHGNYILDCGENTVGQLKRMLPPNELKQTLRDLRMIWISHLHADHHLGTTGLLKEWYSAVHNRTPLPKPESVADLLEQLPGEHGTGQRLPIIANRDFHEMFAEFAQIEDIGYSRVLPIFRENAQIDLEDGVITESTLLTLMTDFITNEKKETAIKDRALHAHIFGTVDIESAFVKHCRGSAGLSLTIHPKPLNKSIDVQLSNGQPQSERPFRVAWSGDCRPSARLAIIGQDADLLIHECTFDTGLEGQAEAKAHSTMQEARRVAEAMGAKSLILTHFSQRYSKVPDLAGMVAPLEGKAVAMQRLKYAATEGLQGVPEDAAADEPLDGMDVEPESAMPLKPVSTATQIDTSTGQVQAVAAPAAAAPVAPEEVMAASNGTEATTQLPFVPLPIPTCAAFDFMHIRIRDIPLMQAYTPALIELFREPAKVEGSLAEAEAEAAAQAAEAAATRQKQLKRQKKEESRQQRAKRVSLGQRAADAATLAAAEPAITSVMETAAEHMAEEPKAET